MAEAIWRATLSANPGWAAQNNARRAFVRGRRVSQIKSADRRKWEAAAAEALSVARLRDPQGAARVASLHFVGVTVTTYWPRRRHLPDASGLIALGDVDATAKAVLDALERADLFDDDSRVLELVCRKRVDPARPRIEAEVWGLDTRGVGG